MKKLFLISILFCFAINSYCQTNFSGEWYFENETSNFSLTLSQTNNIIKGSHCAIADSGAYIDCAFDGENNRTTINGTVQGDSILVTFESGYSGKQGTAVIKRINSTQIQWRITKQPDGVCYIPTNVVMNYDGPVIAGSFTKQPTKMNTITEVPKKADPALIGTWGVSKGEDANFDISKDSIYYPDSNGSHKYSAIGDSLFIEMDENDTYGGNIKKRNVANISTKQYSGFTSLNGAID